MILEDHQKIDEAFKEISSPCSGALTKMGEVSYAALSILASTVCVFILDPIVKIHGADSRRMIIDLTNFIHEYLHPHDKKELH